MRYCCFFIILSSPLIFLFSPFFLHFLFFYCFLYIIFHLSFSISCFPNFSFFHSLSSLLSSLHYHRHFHLPFPLHGLYHSSFSPPQQTVWAWNTVFLLCAAIYLVSATFYITCITDQVQPFKSTTHLKEDRVVEVKVEKPSEVTSA